MGTQWPRGERMISLRRAVRGRSSESWETISDLNGKPPSIKCTSSSVTATAWDHSLTALIIWQIQACLMSARLQVYRVQWQLCRTCCHLGCLTALLRRINQQGRSCKSTRFDHYIFDTISHSLTPLGVLMHTIKKSYPRSQQGSTYRMGGEFIVARISSVSATLAETYGIRISIRAWSTALSSNFKKGGI